MPAPGETAKQPAPGQPTTDRVHEIFTKNAARYDLLDALMSMGLEGGWRRATVRMARLTPASNALDLCAGTGELTLAVARTGRPGSVVGTDFTPAMLAVAERKLQAYDGSTEITFSVADAQALPFPDESFDAVTVGFGVRNLPDRAANFRETLRVLKPGGRYVILEFTTPPNRAVRAVVRWYERTIVPLLGALVAGDREGYQYLNDSIQQFPRQEELAGELRDAGFKDVEWHDRTLGVVAIHVATK